MKIKNKNYSTLWIENSKIKIIDQTKLPFKLIVKELKTLDDFCRAITQMEVRGSTSYWSNSCIWTGFSFKKRCIF